MTKSQIEGVQQGLKSVDAYAKMAEEIAKAADAA
jgi:hypothetical protein